ncbi:hypothetical protein D3C76_1551150 [compost metagenome]
MRALPFLAQLDGFANGAFQHLGLVALGLQFLDAVFDGFERRTNRRSNGATDHQRQS